MTVTNVFEVRQRVPGDSNVSRELGLFTDAGMAKQTIDWLYREVYKQVMSKTFVPDVWITQSIKDTIVLQGYDRWMVDDYNSEFPLFYQVPHSLYNSVPVTDGTFTFTVSESPFEPFTPVP